MRKFLLTTLLFTASLFASDIEWVSLKKAIEVAKDENRMVAVFMTNKHCGYCDKLEYNTLSNERVRDSLNNFFIPVKIDTYSQSYPEALEVRGTPTFYFLNSKGEKLKKQIVGYRDANSFLRELTAIMMRK